MKKFIIIAILVLTNSFLFAVDYELDYRDDKDSNKSITVEADTYTFRVQKIPKNYWVHFVVDENDEE